MDAFPPTLERFVRAVHRRQLAVRVLERAGLGLLGGCVAAAGMVGVLLWRGQDAWAVAGTALALGVLAGAFWGLTDRPTPLSAAVEADRQFSTADLLATAWSLRAHAGDGRDVDPLREAVVALAVARCGTLSPSGVLLRRLGARTWGGIALAVAFVATLAALSDRSPRADAAADPRTPLALETARDLARRPILEITAHDAPGPRRVEQNPADDRMLGSDDAKGARPDPSSEGRDDPPRATSDDRTLSGSSPGTGAGDARSRAPDRFPNRAADSPGPPPAPARSSPDGLPGASTGGAAESAVPAQVTGTGTLIGQPPASHDPTRARAGWAAAAASAREAVRSGRVPDDYRDLVGGYFDESHVGH